MAIDTTGNDRIDGATSEIAVHIRDARISPHVRWREQEHYNEAMRLRDEIIVGTLAMAGKLPPWRPANNGSGKMIWFLIRGYGTDSDLVPLRVRYHYSPAGQLVRYATVETAQAAADKLNGVAK